MLNRIRTEAWRYLGYGKRQPETEVMKTVDDCLEMLLPQIEKRQVHRVYPLQLSEDGTIRIESMQVRSHALARNLKGCREVCLMAATIGFAPDRLAARESAAGRMSRAVIIQAVGSALIESWCDEVNENIRQEAAAGGLYPRPRFSPGYGDFPLDAQQALFRVLHVSRQIGVTLTQHLLMLPSKSVTAVIGLGEAALSCPPSGCEACASHETCSYRRE